MDAVAAVGRAGLDSSQEHYPAVLLGHGGVEYAQPGQLGGHGGELAEVGGEQRAGAEPVVDVLDDGPRDG